MKLIFPQIVWTSPLICPAIIISGGGGQDVNAMYYKRPHSRRAHQMYTLCKCTLDLRLGLLQELEIYRGTARSISAVISRVSEGIVRHFRFFFFFFY